jgi:glutamine synthetase
MATGMLTLGDLKREITAGTIDTVVAAMVDMQGRLIGKRFHAEYFADEGHEETHGCNYLLGLDIEMEPVPGYAATSWEKGYVISSSSPTWPRCAASPGSRHRVVSATSSTITRMRTCHLAASHSEETARASRR